MAIPHRDVAALLSGSQTGFNWLNPEPWMSGALCAQTDPEAFYPDKSGSSAEAKAICMQCTVRAECLTFALDHDERFGIWGGLSERERRRLKQQYIYPTTPDTASPITAENTKESA